MRDYHSEADKVRDLPQVMQYINGRVADICCGHDKILPDAIGIDGRDLPGVDIVTDDLVTLWAVDKLGSETCDTLFSSHYLEHSHEPSYLITCWLNCLKKGGHLVIYMPDKAHYNNHDNPEHLFNWSYEDFLFFFKRTFCGEGKDFRGNHLDKLLELVDSGMDVRENCYSFYIVAKKV